MGEIRDTSMASEDLIVENYKTIISLLCKCNITDGELEYLKNYFRSDIDSSRRYDNIKTLEELFRVLERRIEITQYNLNHLYFISVHIGCDNRVGSLLNLQSRLLSKNNASGPCSTKLKLMTSPHISLPEPVVSCIASQITLTWKSFARALNIVRENEIDRIDKNSTSPDDKIRKVLEVFVHEAKIQRLGNPYLIILRALEEIKRRDVKELVEDLLNSSK